MSQSLAFRTFIVITLRTIAKAETALSSFILDEDIDSYQPFTPAFYPGTAKNHTWTAACDASSDCRVSCKYNPDLSLEITKSYGSLPMTKDNHVDNVENALIVKKQCNVTNG